MRAVTYHRFGEPDVLAVEELPAPVPKPGEVAVRVHAAGLNPKDVLVRKGKFERMSGRGFPRIPGYDFAGVIEAAPSDSDLSPGDEVYGMVQSWRGGTCAEVVCLPADELAPKPSKLSMVEAAGAPLAALTALQALRDELKLQAGDRLLINGASGGVGSFAVQIARMLGARVVAVCSQRNIERMKTLGAHEVVDYEAVDPLTTGPYDLVFDVFGNRPYSQSRRALRKGGRYCTTVPRPGAILAEALGRLGLQRRRRLVVVQSRRRDLEVLTDWFQGGHMVSSIDRALPMEAAAEAHAYIETKRAQGKVVLHIADAHDG